MNVDQVTQLESITIKFHGDEAFIEVAHRKRIVDAATKAVIAEEPRHREAIAWTNKARVNAVLGTPLTARVEGLILQHNPDIKK